MVIWKWLSLNFSFSRLLHQDETKRRICFSEGNKAKETTQKQSYFSPTGISESAMIVCVVLSQQKLTLYPDKRFLAVQTLQEPPSTGDLIKNVISRVKPFKWEHCSLCSAAKFLFEDHVFQ